MTSDLAVITGQLLDKFSDVVVGPAQGSLYATSTSSIVVPQGTLATLSDGRLVRVRKSTQVLTTPTAVPCRPAFLTPAFPHAGNFNPVSWSTALSGAQTLPGVLGEATVDSTASFPASGAFYVGGVRYAYTGKTPTKFTGCTGTSTAFADDAPVLGGLVATWASPPAGVGATADALSFGSGALSSGARCGAVAVHDSPSESMSELFGAGTHGDSVVCVYSPKLRRREVWGEEHTKRRQLFEVQWRMRVAATKLGQQRENVVLADILFDCLTSSLMGATVGSGYVRIDGWEPVRRSGDDGRVVREATIVSLLWKLGRVVVQPGPSDPFDILGIEIRGEGYGTQSPSHTVKQDLSVP